MAKKRTTRQTLPLTDNTASGKPVNVRKAILDRLETLGRSRNWLASQTGLRIATVYEYLGGRKDVWAAKAEKMLTVLGLEIRPTVPTWEEETVRLTRKRK